MGTRDPRTFVRSDHLGRYTPTSGTPVLQLGMSSETAFGSFWQLLGLVGKTAFS